MIWWRTSESHRTDSARIFIYMDLIFENFGIHVFTFLAFHRTLKIGGRNTQKLSKFTTILMNMCCTFYDNQFTDQFVYALRVTIEELITLLF